RRTRTAAARFRSWNGKLDYVTAGCATGCEGCQTYRKGADAVPGRALRRGGRRRCRVRAVARLPHSCSSRVRAGRRGRRAGSGGGACKSGGGGRGTGGGRRQAAAGGGGDECK